MTKRITLIRHAETVANASGVWQGHGDAGLSATGRAQARSLGDRLRRGGITRVLSSDLVRTVETCRVAGLDPVTDPAWREMDIGDWEGLTRDEVYQRFPEQMESLAAGVDVPMGGGESWSDLTLRVAAALHTELERLPDDGHAVVVTHGGVILAAVTSVLGVGRGDGGWPLDRARNTSLTTLAAGWDGMEVHGFNDTGHLGRLSRDGDTLLSVVRHGESAANVGGHWHGRLDGPLSERGIEQASLLAKRLPAPARIYSSPLTRAFETAARLAEHHGLDVETHDGLVEMDLGRWEGLTATEITSHYPEEWSAVYDDGRDLPRGINGETFTDAARRGTAAVAEIAARHPNEHVAVVTHGVLIRAVVTEALGVAWPASRRLGIAGNAAVGRLRFGSSGPVLVDYNT